VASAYSLLARASSAALDPPSSMSDGTDPAVATHHRFYSDKTKTSSATSETEGGLGSDSESASKMQDTQLVRHPGVRLCGRKVSKLFAVASEGGITYQKFNGVVQGSRPEATWGTVYSVRYDDGEEQEVTYEEIIPILHELNEKFPAVPLDIIEASKKAKSDWGVKKHFRHEPTGTRRNLLGVRDDVKSPDAFFGVAKDPKTGIEHGFDVLCTSRFGAAAAHDLLVRRMLAVAMKRTDKTYEELQEEKESFRMTEEEESFLAKRLNFPKASWSEVCGIVLGSVAEELPPVPSKKLSAPAPALRVRKDVCYADDADEPALPEKKKRKDAKTPHHFVLGAGLGAGRVYDSELDVTCHSCRQKTVESHVTCTAPACNENAPCARNPNGEAFPSAFCGTCLKNRHGEDVFDAIASGLWVCPKCCGSCGPGCVTCCNCSFCRKANGLEATGLSIVRAYAAGFGNVHDLLVHDATGEGRDAIARRKLDAPWGAWLRGNRVGPSTDTQEVTPRQSPARFPPPMTPPTPLALPSLFPQALTTTHPYPGGGGPISVMAHLRAELLAGKEMIKEGLLDDEDYPDIKATALASARKSV